MERRGDNQKVLVIGGAILLLGLVVIYFWRQDVEYRRCWEMGKGLSSKQTIEGFMNSRCGRLLKDAFR